MRDLSKEEVKILIGVLYDGATTISGLMSSTNLAEKDLRVLINGLIEQGLVAESGWKGKDRVYEVIRKIRIPMISSICSKQISTGVKVDEDFTFDEDLYKRVLESLDSNVNIVGSKVIYYPFYKVILKRDAFSRELLINAVTGKVL